MRFQPRDRPQGTMWQKRLRHLNREYILKRTGETEQLERTLLNLPMCWQPARILAPHMKIRQALLQWIQPTCSGRRTPREEVVPDYLRLCSLPEVTKKILPQTAGSSC